MTGRLAALAALVQRRPALAAIALGLIAACAYPPLHLWPLGLAALAGFVWLIHSATSWRSALGLGWCLPLRWCAHGFLPLLLLIFTKVRPGGC